jgi:hypothetical protein
LLRKVERIGTNAAEAKCRRHTSVTGAICAVRSETTVGPGKRFDGHARVLQALAKKFGSDLQGLCGFRSGKVENLAEHVCEPVGPV